MLITLILALITCFFLILSILFFPKIKIGKITLETYWIIGILGAILMFLTNSIPWEDFQSCLFQNSSMNPIKILILFFSMTLLSIFLDEVGFFHFLAVKATKIASKNQKFLFVILYLLASFLTIFTSNDIVILTLTPFICYFCKDEDINPLPYLVAEFAAANTWSMMLLIGNPTNIYLASSFHIDFLSYLKIMFLPTIGAGIVEFFLIFLLFYKKLNVPMHIQLEERKIENIPGLILGLIHLSVCLFLMILSSYLNFEMWIISLSCAISLFLTNAFINLLQKRGQQNLFHTLKRAPYALIPFILSMFVLVESLNIQGYSQQLSLFLGSNNPIFSYGISSFLFANIMNNIPMSVFFATLPMYSSGLNTLQAVYATIIGSNIGAFLTPIGALAGILFTELLEKQNVKYGFKSFIFYGVLIAIPTLLFGLGILYFVFTFF